ncbi:MAG: cholesterol esterase [Claussenomyces sp. TS43310]|nr:MAG: cholesterol esterase [Claussenomyces sp. TS43310]
MSPSAKRSVTKKNSVSSFIREASDFVDICARFGYYAEEHVVQTSDGYLLGLHRLGYKKGESDEVTVNCGKNSIKKPVVYLHHGLMMNSEVWVCLTDEKRCLPFALVEKGYDVWLGNNRGNKYSKKCIHHPPTSFAFWDFSMDEFAFHDIPDSINYILSTTYVESLSYIGFSQGTAQAFATLSIHPTLNAKVNVFIALAPAMSPAGLSNGIVDALVKASPQVLFLLFGRRSILASATMWQSILYPPIFVRIIDMGLAFLFGWKSKNMSTSQKLAAYPHLYSFTSTKSVVHWFQIIRTKSFQMYDDDVQAPLISLSSVSKYTKVAKFPTRNIKTPVVLIYGGRDSLVDINVMRRELPPQTIATEIPHYEHLDFLWARDVDSHVFPHVYDALDSFINAGHTKEDYANYRAARHASLGARPLLTGPLGAPRIQAIEEEKSPVVESYAAAAAITPGQDADALASSEPRRSDGVSAFPTLSDTKRAEIQMDDKSTSSGPSPTAEKHIKIAQTLDGAGDGEGSGSPEQARRRRGSGRRGSVSSAVSFDSLRGARGISIGVGRAAGGVVSQGLGVGSLAGSESDTGSSKGKKQRK